MESQAAADSSSDQPEAADNLPSDGRGAPTEDTSEDPARDDQIPLVDGPLDNPFSALDPNGNPFKLMNTHVEWDVMHKILHKIGGVLARQKEAYMQKEEENMKYVFAVRFESWLRGQGGIPTPEWTQQTYEAYYRWRAHHWADRHERFEAVRGPHLAEVGGWWDREMYNRQWLPVIKLMFMFNGQHYCRWCLKEKYEQPRGVGLIAIHRPALYTQGVSSQPTRPASRTCHTDGA